MLSEHRVLIDTDGGQMETFIVHPEGNGPFPAVVMYQNVRGLAEQLRDGARRVAQHGYYCAAPDLYYRLGEIDLDPDLNDEYAKKMRVLALESLMRPNLVVQDTARILSHLDADPVARQGIKGAIGYCVGGYLAPLVAGSFPDVFKATAALHPIHLLDEEPGTPRSVIGQVTGEIYFGIAELDPGTPAEFVTKWNEILTEQCKAQWQVEVHQGVHHGFSLAGRAIYDKAAAEVVWERIFAMFERQLA